MKSNSREKGQLPEYLKKKQLQKERKRMVEQKTKIEWITLHLEDFPYTNNMQSFVIKLEIAGSQTIFKT